MTYLTRFCGAWIGCIVLLFSCNPGSGTTHQEKTAPQKDTIVIRMMSFQPADITVNAGDTIVWINEDIVAHDVSHWPDKSWHSDTLHPHDSFVKIIEDSSSYFCSIHPTMKARFSVKE